MLILGHRGASSICPENTMAAFRKALECGANGVELDVHMTKDGGLVVMHDDLVDRCSNGKGFIKDHTLEEMMQLDVGSWFSPEFAGEHVPTLEDVFAAFCKEDFIINVEMKTDVFSHKGIEEKVYDLMKQYDMFDKVIISSFNHHSVMRMKALDSSVRCGFLYGQQILDFAEYNQKWGVEAVHPPMYMVDEEFLEKCQKNDLEVNVWFSLEPYFFPNREAYKKLPIHSIITNYPQEYVRKD